MAFVIVLLMTTSPFAWFRRFRRDPSGSSPAREAPRTAVVASSPRRTSTGARWVPLGGTVQVRSWTIPGGVYVGKQLAAVHRAFNEPALIDPGLATAERRPDTEGHRMGYWPSYAEIHPESRAAYLAWLAQGRPAGAYIGYVFMFFYGVERRVLVDAQRSEQARAEVPALLTEVERLLSLYRHNGSFTGYATDFLAAARLMYGLLSVDGAKPPPAERSWQVPFDVQLVVGSMAAAGTAIPADWALAWALSHPKTRVRTPAVRCPDEFAELFALRYAARHGDGLVISPGQRMLRLEYRPASASFGGSVSVETAGIPDVTLRKRPVAALADLVESVTDDLDSYSRHVGRHDDTSSPRAIALLPAELARTRAGSEVRSVVAAAVAEPRVIASTELGAVLGDAGPGKLAKRDATAVASVLAAQGVAVEPDVRFGPANFSHYETAVVWEDEEPDADPGGQYAAGTVLLHLGVMISASDGTVTASEEQHLESTLEDALSLTSAGRRRLRAHLRWLLDARPGIAGVKARVRELAADERALIGRYLLAVAGADGHVSPKEVDALKRLYGVLGLAPEAVHGDLHELAAGGPARVIDADADPGDYALPGEVALDRARLSAVMTSTDQVSAVLTRVFADDEPEEVADEPEPDDPDAVAGLDAAHSLLVRRLAAQPSWSREEVERLAAEAGLLAAGAIEAINEAAFDVAGAPLVEGDDPAELDGDVLKEMIDG